jgi:hypothetical protein
MVGRAGRRPDAVSGNDAFPVAVGAEPLLTKDVLRVDSDGLTRKAQKAAACEHRCGGRPPR